MLEHIFSQILDNWPPGMPPNNPCIEHIEDVATTLSDVSVQQIKLSIVFWLIALSFAILAFFYECII